MSAIYATERAQTTRKLPICKFDPRLQGLERWLGPQESAIMAALWDADRPLTVKAVLRILRRDYKAGIAYTTVMTTMIRMYDKALLDRTKPSFACIYRVRESREQFEDRQIAAIMESLGL